MAKTFHALLIAAATAAVSLPLTSAAAADGTPEAASTSLPTQKQRINTLFAELKRESDPEKAKDIANTIRTEWQDSGSASVNLLMQWAAKAATTDKKAVALDMLDQAIVLEPDYVEGWNQRATLNYQMGNYRKSMADINRVLAIEPRHFGALAGMAAILSASGEDELALRAWEQFLAVYPADRQAQEQLGTLEEKLAGNRT